MKNYKVSFLKDGELFETIVTANSREDARKFIANEENIPYNFEIIGNCIYNYYLVNNYVSSVIEL